ncbi:hypothetical protein ASPVEDRAFT_149985 [Aspergillus versicolor CBS 583.65]|uniref:Methyltransferase domain-containing protein n=1 Tax=Aspergillus versicolor CBS 583.65 TaxID=1036611 RepID=A0A1L9PI22_ASPVE|nr:uncharacterized protein ASPVEDRAFT_149985 [Aspergillus versicolor CBS 583.65]OJJ01113.1 hypothetical protein ASPVEDRAFT_149985 [Aspergillus versicolor CBS 583.65]
MATREFSNMFQSKDFASRYRLAEKLTGLFARPLINQSGIASYGKRPVILDNACGTGVISSVLNSTLSDQVKKDWELTCGDLSQPMVEHTQQRAIEEGWHNAEVKVVNTQEMNLPNSYYTHIYTAFAIPMIPDADAALKECLRVLQPGGTYASTNWKTTPQIAMALSSLESLSSELPLPEVDQFQKGLSKGWDSESLVKSVLEEVGFTDVNVTAVTDHASVPIAEFVELNRSFLPVALGKFWTEEQREKHLGRVPEVMKQWLEEKFGVDGVVPLGPTAIVVTARKP